MEKPTVYLAPGSGLQGKVIYSPNSKQEVYTYLGVPFAQPPVGQLRFKLPQPLQLWNGTKDATEFGPMCPQPKETVQIAFMRYPVPEKISEDCLYLNVYTPTKPGHNSGKKLPVMVWIHGGGFLVGASNIYDGRVLASNYNVVVVTINYRLGIFGYLSTEDGHINGNMGQLDQLEALQWVQKYIHEFGGDAGNVTVFGESAGAISGSTHLVSPLAKGLFHKLICESGTTMCHSVIRTRKANSKLLMASLKPLGFTSTNSRKIEEFLMDMSTEKLLTNFTKQFAMVVDGYYLHDSPINLYKTGKFNSVELLCGMNTHEGLLFVNMFMSPSSIKSKEQAKMIMEMSLKQVFYRGLPRTEEICEVITDELLRDCADDSVELVKRVTEMWSVCQFTAPTIWAATLHSGKAKTFLYEFAHRPWFSKIQEWAVSDHTDEIPYVFGEPFSTKEKLPTTEMKISAMLMEYWTNFAKLGNPNGGGLPIWPEFNPKTQEYLRIKGTPDVNSKYKPELMRLVNETVMDLINTHAKM